MAQWIVCGTYSFEVNGLDLGHWNSLVLLLPSINILLREIINQLPLHDMVSSRILLLQSPGSIFIVIRENHFFDIGKVDNNIIDHLMKVNSAMFESNGFDIVLDEFPLLLDLSIGVL